MEQYEGNEIVNVGVGEDISIKELAEKIKSLSATRVKLYSTPQNRMELLASSWMYQE